MTFSSLEDNPITCNEAHNLKLLLAAYHVHLYSAFAAKEQQKIRSHDVAVTILPTSQRRVMANKSFAKGDLRLDAYSEAIRERTAADKDSQFCNGGKSFPSAIIVKNVSFAGVTKDLILQPHAKYPAADKEVTPKTASFIVPFWCVKITPHKALSNVEIVRTTTRTAFGTFPIVYMTNKKNIKKGDQLFLFEQD